MKAFLAASLVVLTTSVGAHAQTYPGCADRTPSAQDVEAAKGMHKAAGQYYAKARYDQAITSWREAYNFDCNAHRLLINIGNAYEKLGDTPRAVEAFDAYVERLGPNADQTIVEKVANLKQLIAQQSAPPTQNGDPTQPQEPDGPYPDEPDTPEPDAGGDTNLAPWILVGAGGAVALVGGILIGVGFGKVNDAESQCPSHTDCSNESTSLGNEGLTLQRTGGALFGIGLAAAAGGVVWYLFDSGAFDDDSSQAANGLALDVGVSVSPDFTGFSLSGAF